MVNVLYYWLPGFTICLNTGTRRPNCPKLESYCENTVSFAHVGSVVSHRFILIAN